LDCGSELPPIISIFVICLSSGWSEDLVVGLRIGIDQSLRKLPGILAMVFVLLVIDFLVLVVLSLGSILWVSVFVLILLLTLVALLTLVTLVTLVTPLIVRVIIVGVIIVRVIIVRVII
jgi:hypothetical protein